MDFAPKARGQTKSKDPFHFDIIDGRLRVFFPGGFRLEEFLEEPLELQSDEGSFDCVIASLLRNNHFAQDDNPTNFKKSDSTTLGSSSLAVFPLNPRS
jgi:hypothetical protein